jgi:hypothetical protein
MTPAQFKAIAWLPADGTWRVKPGRIVAALNSLSIIWPGCVERQWGPFGPQRGHNQRWRLTVAGVEKLKKPTSEPLDPDRLRDDRDERRRMEKEP